MGQVREDYIIEGLDLVLDDALGEGNDPRRLALLIRKWARKRARSLRKNACDHTRRYGYAHPKGDPAQIDALLSNDTPTEDSP